MFPMHSVLIVLWGIIKLGQVLPHGVSATYDLVIYDRWGGIIYHELQTNANDENAGWDGRFNNEQVSQGVYIYSMTIYMSGLGQIEMKRSVTVFFVKYFF